MYKVATVQLKPDLHDIDSNLQKIRKLCQNLDVDLLVLPELVTSGYLFSDKLELETVKEQIPQGRSFSFLTELSRSINSSIVFGFPEASADKIFNSAALINPDGNYFLYRKTHLFYKEKHFFDPGDTGFFVCEAKLGIKIGLMICYDWQFPEAARVLALNGAQIICHPANLVLPWCQQAMITRSLENRVFSITSNRIGTESGNNISYTFTGQSQIVSPKGEVLIRLSDSLEEVGIIDIDPDVANNKFLTDFNDVFSDRRTGFYSELLKKK